MSHFHEHGTEPEQQLQQLYARRDVKRGCGPKAGATLLTRTVVRVSRKRGVAELNTGEVITIASAFAGKRVTQDLSKATRAFGRCAKDVWFEIDMTKFEGAAA